MENQKRRLFILRNRGFNPKVILDIGAYHAEWASMVQNLFPVAKIHLFEANKKHEEVLKNSGFDYHIGLLGDEDHKEVDFYTIKNSPHATGDSMFRENTRHYRPPGCDVNKLKMITLDTILKEKNIKNVDFMKLDVQGAELLILDGAKETLKNVEAVIMETQIIAYNEGAPDFAEVIDYMNKNGFKVSDIVDAQYLKNGELLNHLDVLFLKKSSKLIPIGELS